jgi:MSHA biogenesis protein MshJ
MSDFKQQWEKLGARFNAISQRERALLAVAIVGGIVLVGYSILIDPAIARSRISERLAAQQNGDVQSADGQLQVLKAQLQVDPDAGRKAEIARLKAELLQVESAVKNLEGGLVAPDKMNAVLERLLSGNANLRLLSLKSLAPVNLAESSKLAEGEAGSAGGNFLGLYKHGVEVRLEGSYADLHGWLSQLESTPQKILWGDVRFQVVEHPRSVLSLTIFTLSTDKAWLAI